MTRDSAGPAGASPAGQLARAGLAERVILAGDAAGVINPFNGEGILYTPC